MSKIKHPTKAERLGRWFGGVWRGLVRRDARLALWLNGKGLSIEATKVLIWFLRLVFFGLLFYVALWLALIVVCALAAAWVVGNASFRSRQGVPNRQEDPRDCVSYDPISPHNEFTDHTDSRFPD